MKNYKIKRHNPILVFLLSIPFPQYREKQDKTCMTWGNTIYTNKKLEPEILAHELAHVKQQRGSKIFGTYYIFKYIISKKFRYERELEAYAYQYLSIGEQNEAYLEHLAKQLANPLYGNFDENDAFAALKIKISRL